MTKKRTMQDRNYTPLIITTTIAINAIITVLFFIPKQDRDIPFDITILPRLNAIFNSFTFVFLLAALSFILKKNIILHRDFICAACTATTCCLITYLTYHTLTSSTTYGGESIIRPIYYFVLISHITLAPIVMALALFAHG